MTGRLERWLHEDGADASWLGDALDEAEDDLADAGDLSDLLESLFRSGDGDEVLRASRVPRVRPVLVVLAARASGGAAADAELQYASELLYAALAVHDVALGPNGGRRRRLARRVLRRSMGWLGGNQLLFRAMELTRHTPEPEVFDGLLDTLRAFSEAQELASGLTEEGVPTSGLWSEHADGHTGALFAFCCRAGALAGGKDRSNAGALGRYGRHLGRMWHIAEDVCLLGSEHGPEHLLGRASIGRPMLPVAVGIERDPATGDAWRALLDTPTLEGAEDLIVQLRSLNAIAGTRAVMAREQWDARQALMRLDDTRYRHALDRLASGLCKAPYGARRG